MIEEPYVKGEVRLFEFQVFPNDPKKTPPAVIASAVWELKRHETVISRGNCDVDQDKLTLLGSLQAAGDFTLEVRADVAPETLIGRMSIRVVE